METVVRSMLEIYVHVIKGGHGRLNFSFSAGSNVDRADSDRFIIFRMKKLTDTEAPSLYLLNSPSYRNSPA